MVCTLGRVRMAAMVRLLAGGNNMEITAEEATHEKIAVQTINREFREADEANLLEEEDMHVFDSRPLTDPLHLVCCNACKKPIKASQYAAHAERCGPLSSSAEVGVEVDGGAGHKKPPRKGRKKLQTPHDNRGTAIGEQEKSESIDGDDVAVLESNLDDQNGTISCMHGEVKRASVSADHTIVMDSSGAGQGSTNYLADAPTPLATKIYHPQGNHRLRSALAYLYRESVARDVNSNSSPKRLRDNVMVFQQASSPGKLFNGLQKDNAAHQKNETYPVYAARNPDQILAQSAESCLGASGGQANATSLPNQFHEGDFPRTGLTVDTAPVGAMRMRYHSSPHSFSGNPGASLGAMQQQNGSVPVI